MSYSRAHYRQITEAYKKRFGLRNDSLTSGQWIGATKEIKSMFDDNISIEEILHSFDEAAFGKKQWPIGKVFFKRVHDVALKNRREQNRMKTVSVDGVKSLKEIMSERFKL